MSSSDEMEQSDNPIRPICNVDDESSEVVNEEREVKSRPMPKGPTGEERRKHRLTHYPFRSWCPVCVAGKSKDFPHRRREEEQREFPELSLDYAFPRKEKGGESVTVLIGKDRKSKLRVAHVVPVKGAGMKWIVDQVVRDIRKLGIHGKVILKGDQENSIKDLLQEVAKARGTDAHGNDLTIIEMSKKGDSQSNAIAERTVQEMEDGLRTHILDLEEKLGGKIEMSSPIVSWLVEHVADIYNKMAVGEDGKTSYERIKGKKHHGEFLEPGSQILHRIPVKATGNLMAPRWLPGTWLGKRWNSDEHLVATEEGIIVRTRSVRTRPVEDSWCRDTVCGIKGQPWDPAGTMTFERLLEDGGEYKVPEVKTSKQHEGESTTVPRDFKITKKIIEKAGGPTEGCLKCRAMKTGTETTRAHTAACRKRIKETLAEDESFREMKRRAEDRANQYHGEKLEAEAENPAAEEAELSDDQDEIPIPSRAKRDNGDLNTDGEDTPIDVPACAASNENHNGAKRHKAERGADSSSSDNIPQGNKRDRDDGEDREDLNSKRHESELEKQEREMKLLERESREGELLSELKDELYRSRNSSSGNHRPLYDVCEIFSAPRVTARARRRNLRAGWTMDIDTVDPVTGRSWDLTVPGEKKRAWGLLYKSKPKLLVASLCCDEEFGKLSSVKAVEKIETAVDMCLAQHKSGRKFVLEMTMNDRARGLPCLKRLYQTEGMRKMTSAPNAKKDVFTNSMAIDNLVSAESEESTDIVDLYLDGFAMEESYSVESLLNMTEIGDVEEEEAFQSSIRGFDDVSGLELDPSKIRSARREEMDGFKKMEVYEHVLREDAKRDKDGKFIGVRWVDTLKGEDVRSRLVAQEFAKKDKRNDLYAPTPPLSSARWLVSRCASGNRGGDAGRRLMLIDVKKAFLYGKIERSVYVDLPEEDEMSKSGLYVGKLIKAMYGTRDAPAVWQLELEGTLRDMGFVTSKSTPCLYFNASTELRIVAHVDDLLIEGSSEELESFRKRLTEKYEIKSSILGPDSNEESSIVYLGRKISWETHGLAWEGDEKMVRDLVTEWELSDCKKADTPGAKDVDESKDPYAEEVFMEPEMASRYRSAAAKLNYASLDNPRISYAAKEVSRTMSKPRVGDEVKLKRILRYLSEIPNCKYFYNWQEEPACLVGFTDSDWAGCRRTRRSTSGGAVMHGQHLIMHWSRTQACVALSSCEAELNAGVKMTSELLGLVLAFSELGVRYEAEVRGDCSPMQGVIERRGVGKVKHLCLKQLWMQEKVRDKSVKFVKIPRDDNPSDAMTHHWTRVEGNNHFGGLSVPDENLKTQYA